MQPIIHQFLNNIFLTLFLTDMKRITLFLILTLLIGSAGILNAQVARQFGARRIVLDNNDNIPANNISIIDVNGSLGIDNTGFASGTYPNTNALMTLLAGAKTTNLRIDGGATWGIDVVNTNNSLRTSGSNIFGDGVGNDATTVNISGTGNLTLNGIAIPALPSPLSNLLYLNGSNQVQQTPGGVNVVTGSGTLNTVPLWTPNGNQLGNSILTQPTTSTMVITPTAGGTNVLTVNGSATSTAIKINANGGNGIFIDPATIGLQMDATGTGISYVNSNPTTGISLRAATTGISFANAPTTGLLVQATGTGMSIGSTTQPTTGATITATGTGVLVSSTPAMTKGVNVDMTLNPVTTPNSAAFTASITGTPGANLFGYNANVFTTNAAATGFGCTTNVNGTGNTNGVFASATSNGSGTVNGVFGSANAAGGASGFLNGGTFSAIGVATSNQVTGVSGNASGVNGNLAVGGSFGSTGTSTGNTIGVSGTATSSGAGFLGTIAGVSGTASSSGASSANIYGGNFSATAGPNAQIAWGVNANATGVFFGGSQALGGVFIASGASTNIGVLPIVTNATGTNIGVGIQSQGAGSIGMRVGTSFVPNTGIVITNATTTGISIAGAPTALSVTNGNIAYGTVLNFIVSGNTIPAGWTVVDVGNNGVAASVATTTLPVAAVNGQVCYITTEDPDGVKIVVGLSSVTLSNAEVGMFMFINGTWRLEH